MKVIDEGKCDWKPWWIGQRMTCSKCGRVVELELKDDYRSNWMPSHDDRVTISCERGGNMVHLDRDTLKITKETIQMKNKSDVVSVLRQNGIDCSDLIGGDTVHIFNSRTTEQNLRDLLGSMVRKFKPGVYGTFNPHYNKNIFCEIEVCDEPNT